MVAVGLPLRRVQKWMQTTRVVLKRFPIFSISILALMVFTGVFADFLSPHSPFSQDLSNRLQPLFWMEGGTTSHLLGTDALGRDILSRIIHGSRITLAVMIVGLLLSAVAGIILGVMSGWFGGTLDVVISRVIDASLSFPTILLGVLFSVALGASISTVIIVITLVVWSRYARNVRADTIVWKQRGFVTYAKVAGTSVPRIIAIHILPNVLDNILVIMSLQAGYIVLLTASLSFLGAGIPPPAPSWGGMVAEGRTYISSAWWISAAPGVAIVLVVSSLNLLGDWLRDHLDPKLRQL